MQHINRSFSFENGKYGACRFSPVPPFPYSSFLTRAGSKAADIEQHDALQIGGPARSSGYLLRRL
jgi:hypothetical protein